ncbi:hypothetical protein FAGKG844_470027 [Frankia sp. AgKG'84/4]
MPVCRVSSWTRSGTLGRTICFEAQRKVILEFPSRFCCRRPDELSRESCRIRDTFVPVLSKCVAEGVSAPDDLVTSVAIQGGDIGSPGRESAGWSP